MIDSDYMKSIALLGADMLKNLSTLKYLTIYRDYADVEVIEESQEWAVRAAFPTSILSYDTATYPQARRAVFLNGSSDRLKNNLLDALPADSYLLRLNEKLDLSIHHERYVISQGHAYVSFTLSGTDSHLVEPAVRPNSIPTSEAVKMFGRNGYTQKDIGAYFGRGARWFGLKTDGHLASACFVFQNYQDVWGNWRGPYHRGPAPSRICCNRGGICALLFAAERPDSQIRDGREKPRLSQLGTKARYERVPNHTALLARTEKASKNDIMSHPPRIIGFQDAPALENRACSVPLGALQNSSFNLSI